MSYLQQFDSNELALVIDIPDNIVYQYEILLISNKINIPFIDIINFYDIISQNSYYYYIRKKTFLMFYFLLLLNKEMDRINFCMFIDVFKEEDNESHNSQIVLNKDEFLSFILLITLYEERSSYEGIINGNHYLRSDEVLYELINTYLKIPTNGQLYLRSADSNLTLLFNIIVNTTYNHQKYALNKDIVLSTLNKIYKSIEL